MRAVVIGAGRMGRRHVSVVRALGLDLVGVADPSEAALAEAAKEASISPGALFTDPQGMLGSLHPELVVVATTAPFHSQYVELAVATGATHILCEKPMAISLEECARITGVCNDRGVRFAVNHQMRFMEQYTRPKELLTNLGTLASVNVVAGNFGLAMNGSHYIEMFRFVSGEVPATVQAWFSREDVPNPRGPQFKDKAGTIRITTATGKRFHMEIGSDQGHGMTVTYAGRWGQIFVDELYGSLKASWRKAEHRELPTTRYGMPADLIEEAILPADAETPTRCVLEALLKGVDYPDAAVGTMAVRTLVAAYISDEENHREVSLDEPLAGDRRFPWA